MNLHFNQRTGLPKVARRTDWKDLVDLLKIRVFWACQISSKVTPNSSLHWLQVFFNTVLSKLAFNQVFHSQILKKSLLGPFTNSNHTVTILWQSRKQWRSVYGANPQTGQSVDGAIWRLARSTFVNKAEWTAFHRNNQILFGLGHFQASWTSTFSKFLFRCQRLLYADCTEKRPYMLAPQTKSSVKTPAQGGEMLEIIL